MAGLQRSAVSFRRQGSSGLVWDDRFISEELNKVNQKDDQEQGQQEGQQQELIEKLDIKEVKPSINVGSTNTIERSRSNGGTRGYRTGKVSPAFEPPSPKVSACGFCRAFGNPDKKGGQRTKRGKHRSR